MHDADGVPSRRRVKNSTLLRSRVEFPHKIFLFFFTVYLTGGASRHPYLSRCSFFLLLRLRSSDEIKSVLQPDEVGFHHEVISSTLVWIYHVRKDGFS